MAAGGGDARTSTNSKSHRRRGGPRSSGFHTRTFTDSCASDVTVTHPSYALSSITSHTKRPYAPFVTTRQSEWHLQHQAHSHRRSCILRCLCYATDVTCFNRLLEGYHQSPDAHHGYDESGDRIPEVVQFKNVSSCLRRRSYALSWSQEHHG